MTTPPRLSLFQIFTQFLYLGLTSFGGPSAHIGIFHATFVERKRWLDGQVFTDLVALSHFLPGPSSSQLGMAMGAHWRGPLGGAMAWLGFTLPSAFLMVMVALGLSHWGGAEFATMWLAIKVAVLMIVAQAAWDMAKHFCPDTPRKLIAVAVVILLLCVSSAFTQIGAILLAGILGAILLKPSPAVRSFSPASAPSSVWGWVFIGIFSLGLMGAFLVQHLSFGWAQLAGLSYRTGALVFGGGHVVLPLLHAELVPQLLSEDAFYAGYGAAQLVPGPMFSIASFVGVLAMPEWPLLGACIALVAIFLPSYLILMGVLPFWEQMKSVAFIRAALLGVNAAVVGLLLAVLITSISRDDVSSGNWWGFLAVAFVLYRMKLPPWSLVLILGTLGGASEWVSLGHF